MRDTFTKSDLKSRMVIENRRGEKRIVVDDLLIGDFFYGEIDAYTDNLTHQINPEFDVMRVYKQAFTLFNMHHTDELIWERKEDKPRDEAGFEI